MGRVWGLNGLTNPQLPTAGARVRPCILSRSPLGERGGGCRSGAPTAGRGGGGRRSNGWLGSNSAKEFNQMRSHGIKKEYI